jgi:hypothetical protein
MMKLEIHQAPGDSIMKALIIYDNFAFAARATELLRRAAHQVDTALHWNVKLWRLDTLSLPHRSDEALAEAADARLIVFAGHRTQLLPSWLLDWMERWVLCRQVADIAFAVVGGKNGDEFSTSMALELSGFARRHGISFVVGDGLFARCMAESFARNAPAIEPSFASSPAPFYGCDPSAFHREHDLEDCRNDALKTIVSLL